MGDEMPGDPPTIVPSELGDLFNCNGRYVSLFDYHTRELELLRLVEKYGNALVDIREMAKSPHNAAIIDKVSKTLLGASPVTTKRPYLAPMPPFALIKI